MSRDNTREKRGETEREEQETYLGNDQLLFGLLDDGDGKALDLFTLTGAGNGDYMGAMFNERIKDIYGEG